MSTLTSAEQPPQTRIALGALATGIRTIDVQHRELFSLIDAFEDASAAGDLATAVGTLLPHLEAYVLFHFSEEEQLLVSLANEEAFISLHRAQHQGFVATLERFKTRFHGEDDASLAEALRAFLRSWLTQHIATTDMDLGRKLLVQRPQALWR